MATPQFKRSSETSVWLCEGRLFLDSFIELNFYDISMTFYETQHKWKESFLPWSSHCILEKKREAQSRCSGLNDILCFRTYWPDANFFLLHGGPELLLLSWDPCQPVPRAAVAETLTQGPLQWRNEVQWASNYSPLPWSSNIWPSLIVITMKPQCLGRMGEWEGDHDC